MLDAVDTTEGLFVFARTNADGVEAIEMLREAMNSVTGDVDGIDGVFVFAGIDVGGVDAKDECLDAMNSVMGVTGVLLFMDS